VTGLTFSHGRRACLLYIRRPCLWRSPRTVPLSVFLVFSTSREITPSVYSWLPRSRLFRPLRLVLPVFRVTKLSGLRHHETPNRERWCSVCPWRNAVGGLFEAPWLLYLSFYPHRELLGNPQTNPTPPPPPPQPHHPPPKKPPPQHRHSIQTRPTPGKLPPSVFSAR